MENSNERMGVFSTLMDPAKEAIEKMMAGKLNRYPIAGKDGFWVAPKGTVSEDAVFFAFNHQGVSFVIFEESAQ